MFSDYCLHLYCYFHNLSADMSSGFLQVFVDLGNLQQDAWRNGYRHWFPKLLMRQSSGVFRPNLDCRRVTGILNPCTQLCQTESEQETPVDSIKDVV